MNLALIMGLAMTYLVVNGKFNLPLIILTLFTYYLKMLQYCLICLFILLPCTALYFINIPRLVHTYVIEVNTKNKEAKEGHEAPMVEVKNVNVTKHSRHTRSYNGENEYMEVA